MTQNVRDFYAEMRRQESLLSEPFYFLMSLEDRRSGYHGGVVVEVSKEQAAKFLTMRSHRLATAAEVETWRDSEKKKQEAYLATDTTRILNANPQLKQQMEATAALMALSNAQNKPAQVAPKEKEK